MKKILIWLLAASCMNTIGGRAVADDCQPVRLDKPPGPLTKIPIYDQGTLPVCAVYAAVQLIDAWQFRNSSGLAIDFNHVTSPYALARGLKKILKKDVLKKGVTIFDALRYVATYGSCDLRVKPDGNEASTNAPPHSALIEMLKADFELQMNWNLANKDWLYKEQARLSAAHPHWDLFQTTSEVFYRGALKSGVAALACQSIDEAFKAAQIPLPAGFRRTYTDLLAAMLASRQSSASFASEYIDKMCAQNTLNVPQIPLPTHIRITDTAQIQSILHKRLLQPRPQPVEIEFCAHVLVKKDPPGYKANRCVENDSHSVLVVGQRRNKSTDKCEFLVRNSWGVSCEHYKRADWECERGQIWVDAEVLSRQIYALTYLEE